MAAIADVEADLPAARSRWLRMALGTRSRQGEGVQNSGEPGTLFGSFREGILSELISGAERRRLSAGSLIFEHGSRADNIYFVLSGSLECQLLREDRELGLEAHTRPNPPINEVVALESPARGGRSPFAACDFVLEEPAPLRSSRIAHPKLLKSVTAAAFPVSSLTEPASVRSTHPSKEKPSKSTGPSVCTMTPREALRRDDRLLRPVADVVRALAASIPAEPKPELESFQQRWQQFQAHVGGLVDTRTQKSRDAGASTARAMKVEVAEASAAEEPPPKEDEPAQQELLQAPSPRARLTRLVAVCKEVAGPGDIVGAVACLASQTHKWTALAGDGCEVLALSASSLKRAVKRELSCRHSERTEKLLMALGHLRALDEDKLHQLAVASRSVLYRRGEVLCWEGDLRTPQSHLEVLMTGEARRLRATVESANTAPSKDAPKLTRTRSARSLASMQHAGSLIAGQAANASSVLADCGEPFTVVVESAELMGLSLSWADLVRFVPAPLLEELKGWALQRLAWHRTQISKLLQEVKQVENSSAHGGASKKLPERSLLNGVLHDQPEMICRKAKQPPGSLGDDGRDMLTSTLAIHRRPDPLTAECPTVHEALIPYMKGHAKPPESPRSAFASSDELTSSVLLTSTSNLWDEPAAELLEKVVRTCEDWGLRKISAAATKLHKRESFNSGLKPWRKERIVARGCSGGALVEVRPIEPLQIARCLPSSRPSPELPALTAAAVQEVVKKMPFRGKAKSGRHLSTLRRGVSAVCPPLVPVQAPLWSPGSMPPRSASKSRLAPLGMLPLADKACRPQKTSQPEGPKVRSLDAFLVKGPRRPGGPRRLLPRHVHLS